MISEWFSSFSRPYKKLNQTKKLKPATSPPHFLMSDAAAEAEPPVAKRSS